MAELADALDLGSSGNTVQVQVLSPVPNLNRTRNRVRFFAIYRGPNQYGRVLFLYRKPRDSRVAQKSLNGEDEKELLMCWNK